MPVCFIISPIGESGSETRRNADDLRDLLIKPVLEPLGFEVVRGDHRSDAGQIDIDVIRAVQEADLCIADISLPNPRDEESREKRFDFLFEWDVCCLPGSLLTLISTLGSTISVIHSHA